MCKETLSRMAVHNKECAVIEVIIQQASGIPEERYCCSRRIIGRIAEDIL